MSANVQNEKRLETNNDSKPLNLGVVRLLSTGHMSGLARRFIA
jgi:hypothetical protein